MSLPAFLSSSYKQYKEDTNCFTTWLHQAAANCGYKTTVSTQTPTPQKPQQAAEVITAPSQRLKGKARKLAKQAAGPSKVSKPAKPEPKTVKRGITTKELLNQARAVAENAARSVVLPNGIRTVTERAIAARQRCAAWFVQSGASGAANEKHQHFIEVLQNALDLLTSSASSGTSKTNQRRSSPQADELDRTSNRFGSLDLEEIDEEYPMTPLDVSLPTAKQHIPHSCEIYELDDEFDDFEDAFALFCFFEDLHAIQDEIQSTWRRFANGDVTLEVATVVTQAGIDVVKRLEKEVLALRKDHNAYEDPYTTLSMPVFYAESLIEGEDPREVLKTPKALEHKPFHDFIYLPTAKSLIRFADVSHKTKDKTMWPPPVLPMRFSYITRPELLDLPDYKNREEEDRILIQLLLEVLLIDDTKDMLKNQGMDDRGSLPDTEDEFLRAARELWTYGRVSTSAVFVSRLTLDILEICGGRKQSSFQRRLLDAGERAEQIMGFIMDQNGAVDTHEVRWLTKDQHLIMQLYQTINVHILNPSLPILKEMMLRQNPPAERYSGGIDDLPAEAQEVVRKRMIERGLDPDEKPTEEHSRNAKNLNIEWIRPSEVKDFLPTHNALYCGSLSLKLTSLMEEAGIALANHHMSIFATAHLYNALKRLQLIEISWPEMEDVIDLHCNALFANDVPRTPHDLFRRFSYRTGLTGPSKNFDKKQAWKLRTGNASTPLKQLFENKDTVENALVQLETQVSEHASHQERNDRRHTGGRRRRLKPLQLLSHFEEHLPTVLKDMQIDYIGLTRTCNKLMQKIRQKAQRELGVSYPVVRSAGDSNDHGCVYIMTVLLDENAKAHAVYERMKIKEPFKGGEQIQLAARTFEEFFAREGPGLTSNFPRVIEA